MLWISLIAGAFGLLLGLCMFRVQLVAVATAALIPLCLVITPVLHWGPLVALAGLLALAVFLQGGYLVGAALAMLWAQRAQRGADGLIERIRLESDITAIPHVGVTRTPRA
jgi:hypothetical protein